MTRVNTTRLAVLGVLSWGDGCGYDIKKTISESLGHVWSESYGQLYPTLDALVGEGLVTVSDNPVGRRRRRRYSITPGGRAALREMLRSSIPAPPPREPFLLKLMLGSELVSDEVRAMIDAHRQETVDEVTALQGLRRMLVERFGGGQRAVYWTLAVDYGLALDRAVVEWCDDALAVLETAIPERSRR